nr:threonine/serine exporter family protein [Microbacterium invictum]
MLGLAEGMNASAESVDRVQETMARVATAYGSDDTDFMILPTVILVETGGAERGRVVIRSSTNVSFRFDQIAALYTLIEEAKLAEVDPDDGIERLNEIGRMRPSRGWFLRTLGHAVLTAGLALLLAPTWQGVIVAFVLGAVIGLLKLVPSSTLQLIMPVVAAGICAVAVFGLTGVLDIGDPISLLIAPLVTFLPGGALTTGTVELAAGQMLAGSSRLVYGFVQLGLLAFGILAGGTILGVDSAIYTPTDTPVVVAWWVPLTGVVVFAVGNYLHFSAPVRTFGWVLLALFVAYFGQLVGAALIGPAVSGFIGAVAMTPVVLWIAALRHGAPSQLTFLPAFWLLVPGAAGLAGLTALVATDVGRPDFTQALASVLSIALGVLIGTAMYRAIHHGTEAVFAIAMPSPEAPPRKFTWWFTRRAQSSSKDREERA